MFQYYLSFFFIFACVNTLYLPSYLKPCKYNSPDFSKCAVESANAAIPTVAKGDKKYKVPSAKPYKIIQVNMDNPNFKFRLSDLDISGVENLRTNNVQLDLDKKHMKVILGETPLEFKGKYEIDGKIVLPIKGNGDVYIKIDDPVIDVQFDYELKKKDDGKEYLTIINTVSKLDFNKAHVQLDNLFNGDKALGDNMNKVLNDNWDILKQDLSQPISKTLESIALTIASGYFSNVPFQDLFTH